jgi:hypothetical protein
MTRSARRRPILRGMAALSGLLLIALLLSAYFAPSVIALARHHHNVGTIVVIDLLLGWTFIGWVVALAMAAGSVRPAYDPYGQPPYGQVPHPPRPPLRSGRETPSGWPPPTA